MIQFVASLDKQTNEPEPRVMIDDYMGGDRLLVVKHEVDADKEPISIRCGIAKKTDCSYLGDPECKLEYGGCGIISSNLSAEAICLSSDVGSYFCSTPPEFLLGYRDLVLNPPQECPWGLYEVIVTTKGLDLKFCKSGSQVVETIRFVRPLFYNYGRTEYLQVDVPTKISAGVPNIIDVMGWQIQKLCFRISTPDAHSTLISVAYPHQGYGEKYFLPALRLIKGVNGQPDTINRYYRLEDISKNPDCLTKLLSVHDGYCCW